MEDARISLTVEGMTCNHCASTVNGIIQQEGGKEIEVDYLMGEARFDQLSDQKLQRILDRLDKAGYKAAPEFSEQANDQHTGLSSVERKFLTTLPFSLVLFAHMFVPHDWWLNNPWVQLALCVPVFVIGLWHFGGSTYEALRSGTINMDLLILLGGTSAFVYSLYGTIAFGATPEAHPFLFYETTSTIISLVLLGYVIESRAVKRTTKVLRDLFKARPEKAKKLVQNGLNQDLLVVNASTLQKDDVILVNTGDRIPADGTLMHGSIELDESMLTGESEPKLRHKDDQILSGALVLDGNGTIRVTKTGADSTIGRIVSLIKASRAERPAVQKLADQISAWFVPTIVGVAVLTFTFNFFWAEVGLTDAILRSVAVLVIACPCAMGLATPTAVSVGLGLAGRLGIIVKRASVFEALSKVTVMVFDKTGTLTKGKLKASPIYMAKDWEASRIWGIIKTLELHSSHPIAKSLLEMDVASEQVGLENVREIKGAGMTATWQGKDIRFGTAKHTSQEESDADLYLCADGTLIASLQLQDELKPESAEALKALRKSNLNIHLLSGDNARKTSTAAKALDIEHYRSAQLPDQKLAYLKTLQQKYALAMVGDGINDAPALAAANVGISIGNTTALASESAQVVIMGSSLNAVTQLMRISKRVVAAIRQNLFWAFAYNIVAVPLAAMGYLDPMLAALSMAFSDVVVIGNSLRLRFVLPKQSG